MDGTSTFEVQLSQLVAPGPGFQIVTVQMEGSGTVTVELLQNVDSEDVLIASWTADVDSSSGFTSYSFTLTAAQAAAIVWPSGPTTDPLLRVLVSAPACSSSSRSSSSASRSSSSASRSSSSASRSSSGGECFDCGCVPATLYATIIAESGPCTCMNGLTSVLTINVPFMSWEGVVSAPCGGCGVGVEIFCSDGVWSMPGFQAGNCSTATVQWNPLNLVFDCVGVQECCTAAGTVTVVVTETPP
jgi:hypothetical protein